MTSLALRFAIVLALPFTIVLALPFVAATVVVAKEKSYRPLPAEIGAEGAPPAELVERAKAVIDAVEAGSADEVYAFMADRPTVVSSGITLGVPRRIETKGPFADATAALAEIGSAYTEGEPVSPTGKKLDMTATRVRTAIETIGERLRAAKWGRDPLVPGAWCTVRGVRWDAKAAAKTGLDGERGIYVTEKAVARASADATAKVVAPLKPGVLYRSYRSDEENGFSAIVLPDGAIGWVAADKVGDPTPWGLCFEKRPAGWILTTFVSALN
jgi:hypothetical protein